MTGSREAFRGRLMDAYREAFRGRLMDAYRRTLDDTAAQIVADGGDACLETIYACRHAGNEAVYAAALRDAIDELKRYGDPEGPWCITEWAASLGIDLEGEV